jgi:hypothetical protein
VAGEVGGLGEEGQLLGPELLFSIGRGEELVYLIPLLLIARFPGSVEEGVAVLAHGILLRPAGTSRF